MTARTDLGTIAPRSVFELEAARSADPESVRGLGRMGEEPRSTTGHTTRVPHQNAAPLRVALLVDAAAFLAAALLNLGVQVPLGFATLRFADPIWQAGTGEAVIGTALLAAGLQGHARLAWVALWMSVLGIAVGLSSARVQGAARGIHVVLVPLAIIVFTLLLRTRPRHTSMRREDAAK